MITVGSDFSGVGAFNQALMRLGIDFKEVFACDMDKYARETFIHNYGEPTYYPENVYDREIPKESLSIYMTSPPCQAFSLAGKRKGEDDKRGVLFYNSHEFIQVNKPRYFIFENVKGLLSDAKGRTFQIWLDMLGGKSVNGNPVIFPREDATPYHIYYKVLNAKNYGVPQNRERVFIIGIRDDADNSFHWPKKQHLTKRLKDVLEVDVDQKYYLSDKMINYLHQRSDNFNNGKVNYKDENDTASCITKSSSSLDISDNIIKVGNTNPSGNGMNGNVFDAEGISPTLSTNKGEGIKVKSATKKGFEIANEGDSINLSNLNSETRRGRVGKEVAQTLDTACNQAVIINPLKDKTDKGWHFEQGVYDENGITRALKSSEGSGNKPKVIIGAIRGRNPENPLSREIGLPTEQRLELNMNGTSNALTTVQKDNVVVYENQEPKAIVLSEQRKHGKITERDIVPTLLANTSGGDNQCLIKNEFSIRRLTPRECFRLMDFPDTFNWPVSNSQAYKQAGNSIVVNVLAEILKKLNL